MARIISQVEIANSGEFETHYHDEETVAGNPELEEAWREYKRAASLWQRGQSDVMMKAIALKGIEFDMPETDDWIAEQELLGIEVPEDPASRRVHYLQTEIVGSVKDMVRLLFSSMGMTGMDEEANGVASRLFPADL